MKRARVVLSSLVAAAALALATAEGRFQTTAALPAPRPHDLPLATVNWTVYPADFLSCKSPASAFRHIANEFGPRVRLVAYMIGVDEGQARSFLRRERLDIELVTATPAEYRAIHGRNPRAGIQLVQHGKVFQEYQTGSTYQYPSAGTLRSALRHLIPAAAPRSPANPLSHSASRRQS